MQYKISILISGVLVLFAGCSVFGATNDKNQINLVLSTGFNQDWVVVEVGGKMVVADTLTSSEFKIPEICCSPAASINVTLPPEEQQIRIRVNESLQNEFEFDASKWSIIVIRYNRHEQRLILEPRNGLFIYEG